MAAKNEKKGRFGSPSIENRKARHEYTIEDTFEAGLALTGTEVKSIREGNASLQDSYCQVTGGELWLQNMYVKPYDMGNRWNQDERRPRKLLVKKGELLRLYQKTQQKGLTLIPLKLYFTRGWAKIQVGIARGKQLHDKRESIRQRDLDREARREMTER